MAPELGELEGGLVRKVVQGCTANCNVTTTDSRRQQTTSMSNDRISGKQESSAAKQKPMAVSAFFQNFKRRYNYFPVACCRIVARTFSGRYQRRVYY